VTSWNAGRVYGISRYVSHYGLYGDGDFMLDGWSSTAAAAVPMVWN
jgi:hypothetical protein